MTGMFAGDDSVAKRILTASSAKHADVAQQRELFPLQTVIESEENGLGSDAWGRVFAVDGRWYIVKGQKGGAFVRASEWIGTNLAEAVEILCPTPQIIQMSTGDIFFGSAVIESIAEKLETVDILASSTVPPNTGNIVGLGTALSRIFVFDMFINNIDRHQFNFISRNDNGTQRIYAIDFGRSLSWAGNLNEFPAAGCHTRVFARAIRGRHGFDLGAASSHLDRIARVDRGVINSICERMPTAWDSDHLVGDLLLWWGSGDFFRKVENLREGLFNGSLL